MKASVRVITLGVADLERSLRFYGDGLGLRTEGVTGTEFEGGAVVFFELAGGVMLALYPLEEMLKSAGLPRGDASRASPRRRNYPVVTSKPPSLRHPPPVGRGPHLRACRLPRGADVSKEK